MTIRRPAVRLNKPTENLMIQVQLDCLMSRVHTENMKKALVILQRQYETPKKLLALTEGLKKEKGFGLTRKLLDRALQDGEIEKVNTNCNKLSGSIALFFLLL